MDKKTMLSEFVENHSTEEVVKWVSGAMTKLLSEYGSLQSEGVSEGLILGQLVANLAIIQGVAGALDRKVNRRTEEGPVVA